MTTYRIHFVDMEGEEFTYYGDFESEQAACISLWSDYKVHLITLIEVV